jgi:hypothetical protein
MSLKEVQGSEQFSIMLVDRQFKGSEQFAFDVDPKTGSITIGVGDLAVAKGHIKFSVKNGIVAFAGGGQANATVLPADINRVSTVATAADSTKLPKAVPGLDVTVYNAGANSMNVFPLTGDNINALAANAAFAVAAGKNVQFGCAVAGTWHAILSA